MTLRLSQRDLVDAVGRRLGRALGAMSIKEVQAAAGHVSPPTASNYRRGELPDVFAPFFATLKAVGIEAALKVLEPLIGPADPAYHLSRLDEIEQTLRDIRHGVQTGRAVAGGSAGGHAARPAPEGGAAQDRRGGAGRAGGLPDALVDGAAGAGEGDRRSLALTRQLEPFRRPVSLSEAVAIARAAGNISLGFRPATDRRWRLIYPSRLNRLVPRDLVGLPYLAHPDRAYGLSAQRDMEEAEAAPGGVSATVAALVTAPRPIQARYDAFRLATKTPDGGHLVAAAVCRLDGWAVAA